MISPVSILKQVSVVHALYIGMYIYANKIVIVKH